MNKIIDKFKIVAAIIVSLFITILFGILILPVKQKSFPKNLALRLVLTQTKDQQLSMQRLEIEDRVPKDYRAKYPFNYYVIKFFDNKNKELYSGYILHTLVIPPHDYFETKPRQKEGISIKVPETLDLLLPYFKNAQSLAIYDEKNNVRLQTSIKNLKVPGK